MLIFAAARCFGLYYIAICIVPAAYTVRKGGGLNVALLQLFVLDCAGVHYLCIEKGEEQYRENSCQLFISYSAHTQLLQ